MRVAILSDILNDSIYQKGVFNYTRNLISCLSEMERVRGDELIITDVRSIRASLKRGIRYDIIHLPQFRLDSLFSKSYNEIITIHGTDFYIPPFMRAPVRHFKSWLRQRLLKFLSKDIIASVKKFIAVSDFLRDELIYEMSIPEEQVVRVHEGVDHSIFKPMNELSEAREEERRKNSGLRFLLTDTPSEDMLRVFKSLKEEERIPHMLLVAGIRAYTLRGFEVAKALGINRYVRFLGHLSQHRLAEIYNLSEVFIHYSRYDGFGLQNLEAMACGCPVVTTVAGAIPEVVGDAALLSFPDDLEMLKTNINEVLSSHELREEMRIKGIKRANKFSWQKTAEETYKIYKEVSEK